MSLLNKITCWYSKFSKSNTENQNSHLTPCDSILAHVFFHILYTVSTSLEIIYKLILPSDKSLLEITWFTHISAVLLILSRFLHRKCSIWFSIIKIIIWLSAMWVEWRACVSYKYIFFTYIPFWVPIKNINQNIEWMFFIGITNYLKYYKNLGY